MPAFIGTATATFDHLNTFSNTLTTLDINATMQRIDDMLDQVKQITLAANSTDGTFGMLLHDKRLYTNLNTTVRTANSLLTDLEANPKRYVHFSLFGRKDKSKTTPVADNTETDDAQ